MTPAVFRPLSMRDMAKMINSANQHVTVACPGIDEEIAGALVSAAGRITASGLCYPDLGSGPVKPLALAAIS